jgi:hypothetical protein
MLMTPNGSATLNRREMLNESGLIEYLTLSVDIDMVEVAKE